ncbi:MAG: stalk domain-containing protein [Caldisericum sp.]|uniref:stalk domain-containing protein n=1 Tax=Caldisericum sp. TaxID=2499687 RepID=UPI003D0D658D
MKKLLLFVILFSLFIPNVVFGKTLYWKTLLTKDKLVSHQDYFTPIKGIVVDPNNPNIIYLASWGNGVLKSEDGGAHFYPINDGLSELYTYTVKVDPNNSNILYVGTATGVFVSYNSGATFSLLQDLRLDITSIEFGTGVLYAGVFNNGVNAGLYKFVDNKWVEVGLSDLDIISIARLDASTLLLGTSDGLYSFDEKTSTFKFLGFQGSAINSVAVSSKKIVLGTSNGVYESDSAPLYFVPIKHVKLSEGNFLSVAIYKDNPYKFITGQDNGFLYRFDLNTGAFEMLIVNVKCIYSLFITKDDKIFVGTENAFLWSDNNGQSFKGFSVKVSGGELQVDPLNKNIIYVGSDKGLFKSVDGGVRFINLGLPNNVVFSIAINPNDDKELFVGTSLGLFRSNDFGKNFTEIKQFSGYSVTFVAISPSNQRTFAGSELGLFVSSDHGETWEKSLSIKDGDFIPYIAIDPTNSNTIYAVTFIDGLYKTTDGGKTWQYLGYSDLIITSISICKRNPNLVYMSTIGSVYVSVDGGKSFIKTFNISAGLYGSYEFKQVVVDEENPNIAFAVGDLVIYGQDNVTKLLKKFYDEPFLYMTKDMGKNWEKLDLPNTIEYNNAIYFDKETNSALLLTGIGILHYDFNSMRYYYFTQGFPDEYIRVVKFFNDSIFVGTDLGNIGKSSDGGETFKFHAKFDNPILSLFQSPTNPDTIYAGTSMGLLVSTDFGSLWRKATDLSDAIYKITGYSSNGHDIIFLGTDTGIFEIDGFFDSIRKIYDGICTALYYDNGKLYAGTDNGLIVTNDFKNFEIVKDIQERINVITTFDNSVLAGTMNGLYVISGDGVKVVLENTAIFDILSQNNVVYLATDSGVLILNKDLSYTPINNGLTNYYATSITSNKNGDIFLGTDGGGLFKLETIAILKVLETSGGKIEPSGEFTMFSSYEKEFLITPNLGFRLKDVLLNGNSYLNNVKDLGNGTYALKISGIHDDSTLQALFAPITFTITASSGVGGAITPSGTITVNYGDSKTFTINPNPGYTIKDVKVDNVSVGAVSSYTFSNITSNHKIEATFEKQITIITLQIGNTSFTVNGEQRYLDSPPVIKNGRTLLPIRAIIEALGGTVKWIADTKTVVIELGNNSIMLQIGNANALVNGNNKLIDPQNLKVVPEIINSRTMLPLRFVAENLGCDVQWDGTTKTITITYQGG